LECCAQSPPPPHHLPPPTQHTSHQIFPPPPPLKFFPPPAIAATAMAAPTALGHRRLSAQIYQRPERNGHRKYFDKSDCHRPLLCGKKTCARALSSISRHFALHSRCPLWVKSRHVQT